MASVIDDDPAHPPPWDKEPFCESTTGENRHLDRYFSFKKEEKEKMYRGGEGGDWHIGFSRKDKVVVDLVGCQH